MWYIQNVQALLVWYILTSTERKRVGDMVMGRLESKTWNLKEKFRAIANIVQGETKPGLTGGSYKGSRGIEAGVDSDMEV
ncbi:hypothetical protein WAI453_013570 [Rhynchosporium graminicola]